MKTNRFINQLIVLCLALLLVFGLATPALAFDDREGDDITIAKDEVVDDDLYLFANTISVDGTVKGDLVVFGSSITINGIVEGDLIAAGRDVTINGEVKDDVRFAAYALTLGPNAKVGDDMISAGYSLEIPQGANVDGTLVLGAYQLLLNGNVGEGASLGLGALELNGTIGGDVKIGIGDEDSSGIPPSSYMKDMPPVPFVKAGMKFGPNAKINGNIEYTSSLQYSVPESVTSGEVTHMEMPVAPKDASEYRSLRETNPVLDAILEALRFLAALVILGVLVAILVPSWIKRPAEMIEQRPLPSLGWGFVTFMGFFFFLGLVGTLTVVLAILFGALTLGNLSGLSVVLGGSAFCALIVAFALISGYLSYLIIGYLGGRWILQRISPALNEKPVWPLLLGVLILAILTAIPVLGAVIKLFVILFGLGAIALLLWKRIRPTADVTPAPVIAAAQ